MKSYNIKQNGKSILANHNGIIYAEYAGNIYAGDPVTAIAGGALLGTAGIIGASKQSSAIKKASQTQADAANQAAQIQQNMFNTAYSGQMPFQNIGYSAAPLYNYLVTGELPQFSTAQQNELANLQGQENLDLTGQNRLAQLQAQQQAVNQPLSNFLTESPAYQWQQQQGEKAINRAFAQRGGYNSSGAINALSNFNQSLGAQEYQNQYNRLLDALNIGRGAAATSGSQAQNTANSLANIYSNQGANQANLQLQQGQNQASLWSNLGALPLNVYSAYKYGNALNKLSA